MAAEAGPIATTSANRHGEPTPARADAWRRCSATGSPWWSTAGGATARPSTVVDATGPAWTALRVGSLSLAEVEQAADG